jgi:hypothetical protein
MNLLIRSLIVILWVSSLQAIDKWIVVTTIQYPTEQLKKMAQIPGWQLLVVGDKTTPVDWHLDGCEYLSPSRQMKLGYQLVDIMPWKHYCRKNIGYLYAIEHGATIIYETDDDNEPIGELNPLPEQSELSAVTTNERSVNIYKYFGLPEIWPRGFPLELLEKSRSSLLQISPPTLCRIGFEQGVVDQAPDVDAIFRLGSDKEFFFKKMSPCYLPPGTYCPFNTQNTFIHRSLFFALYLPSSISMRLSDIWRGYIAEKLMETSGHVLVFTGPNAIQQRNVHNIYDDFILEQDLYLKSGKLVKFLQAWQNPTGPSSIEIMTSLFDDLILEKFLGEEERLMLSAWQSDLQRIGYSL